MICLYVSFGTLFHDLLHECVTFPQFVCQFRLHFGKHFAMILTITFKHQQIQQIGLLVESCWAHLRPHMEEGGNGAHLGGIWHLGGTWEASGAHLGGILGGILQASEWHVGGL